jgi:hypothetical protein
MDERVEFQDYIISSSSERNTRMYRYLDSNSDSAVRQ